MYKIHKFVPLINFKGNSPPSDFDDDSDNNEEMSMNEEETRELKQSAATIVIATLAVLLILIVIMVHICSGIKFTQVFQIVLWMAVKRIKLRRERRREVERVRVQVPVYDGVYDRPSGLRKSNSIQISDIYNFYS